MLAKPRALTWTCSRFVTRHSHSGDRCSVADSGPCKRTGACAPATELARRPAPGDGPVLRGSLHTRLGLDPSRFRNIPGGSLGNPLPGSELGRSDAVLSETAGHGSASHR